MPQLGLGLGLSKNDSIDNAYNDLKRLSTWFIDPARPEGVLGTATAFNAKPANPILDQRGTANVTMTNVAWTSADGYRVETAPNGKQVVGFKGEGSDTYGVVASNGPNPTSGDFAYAQTFRTASTLATQYLFTRAEQSEATCQIGIKLTNTGVLSIILEGTNIQIATGLLVNTFYDLVVTRIGGTLKALLNGVEVLSVANSTVLTSRPNVRIGALSTNAGGTTHTEFSNVTLFPYGFTTTDETKFATNWRKYATKEYGL